VAPFLEEIVTDLKAGRYQPQPVLRVYIPKPDGRQRPLGFRQCETESSNRRVG